MELRPYQKECIDIIESKGEGSFLCQLATGMGKTVTFANLPRHGRTLILSHRDELVNQPRKYFNCSFGVEQARLKSDKEEVVSASVQSLVRRLDKFSPYEFDRIITDEAHHAAAKSYKKIYEYFKPRQHIGFTATPNRGDNLRLDDVYQEIIYEKDLKWGIKNGYLCSIDCRRINIGYDISKVARRMGDFATGELDKAMNIESQNKAIAQAYKEHAKGQTLIFAVSVEHAQKIADEIPGAQVVSAETKNRAEIIKAFTERKIPCLVNCMIFTEGTDLPLIETIIIARPTANQSLYAQMVGRGLRLSPGKEKLTLLDCVGVSGKVPLCTAPSLIGLDTQSVPKNKKEEIEGDLFDLPDIIIKNADCPDSWINNVEIVNIWAKKQEYNTHGVNYFKMPSGDLVCQLRKNKIVIPAQDELGMVPQKDGTKITMQKALDMAFIHLSQNFADQKYIWDLRLAKIWGKEPASDKQIKQIQRRLKRFDCNELTKLQASQILNRLYA